MSCGGVINTGGTLVLVYPLPTSPTDIAVTFPPLTVAVADALTVVPKPTGLATVTVGACVYPTPAFVMSKDEIVPAMDTKAVADAPTIESWDVMVILFWNVLVCCSLVESKNGLTLLT